MNTDEYIKSAPLAQRIEDYHDAREGHWERWSEAGSSWVCGGGSQADASTAADEAVGRAPARRDFGFTIQMEHDFYAQDDFSDLDDDDIYDIIPPLHHSERTTT